MEFGERQFDGSAITPHDARFDLLYVSEANAQEIQGHLIAHFYLGASPIPPPDPRSVAFVRKLTRQGDFGSLVAAAAMSKGMTKVTVDWQHRVPGRTVDTARRSFGMGGGLLPLKGGEAMRPEAARRWRIALLRGE